MNTTPHHESFIKFAMKLAGSTAVRIQHRTALANLDAEDIEQELIAYVLEHADRYTPQRGNVEAFVTLLMQTAVAKLIREASRQRSAPPAGVELQSLSTFVDGPNQKSEELTKGLAATDNDRRRQTISRDPLKSIELADAIEHQIRTLPKGCRKCARLLQTHSQAETAARLGWSKRKVMETIAVIRKHFAAVEWDEVAFTRDQRRTKSIASTGKGNISQPLQATHQEQAL